MLRVMIASAAIAFSAASASAGVIDGAFNNYSDNSVDFDNDEVWNVGVHSFDWALLSQLTGAGSNASGGSGSQSTQNTQPQPPITQQALTKVIETPSDQVMPPVQQTQDYPDSKFVETVVSEPGVLALFALGLAGIVVTRRKNRA
ncbi:MAG: PEP-CTERM sorting domain-containing protein [Pseudomonadota bacterium]